MTKDRNSEDSRQKILDVSRKLFLEKGYDNTSIQDIVNGLGGMTKGAIYHYFNSKFDIFETIANSPEELNWGDNWLGDTGLEKIRNKIISSLSAHEMQAMFYSAAVTLKSPRMIGEQYLENINTAVPMIEIYVKEGLKDGSIETKYPTEIAELVILAFNMLIGIRIFDFTKEEFMRKIYFIKDLFEGLGIELVNNEVLETAKKLITYLKEKNC